MWIGLLFHPGKLIYEEYTSHGIHVCMLFALYVFKHQANVGKHSRTIHGSYGIWDNIGPDLASLLKRQLTKYPP